MSHKLLDETSSKAFRAAKLRYQFIVGTIVFIALVCVGIFLYQNKQKKHFAKLTKEYAQIESLYYQENQQALDSPSKSLQDTSQTANHEKSTAQFRQFALDHLKDPLGWQAAIRASNYDINNGNIQAAKELFEAIMPYTFNFPLIQVKFGVALAEIYASEQNYEKSLERIEYVEKVPKNPILDETKLLHGQILYKSGKTEDAIRLLKTLNTEQAKIWLNYIES